MVSATSSAANALNLLIAIICCTYLSNQVESFSLHSLSAATRNNVDARAIKSQQQQVVGSSSSTSLFMSDAALSLTGQEEDDDDEEEEWVEEEFELLTERDFYNTEWKIGTLMDGSPRSPTSIDTTWVRLVTTEDGINKAVWGDGSKGKWTIDVPSQFFSISKETFGGWLGKQIWAGTIDDFYYLDGTVRGWSPISPASVVGQWQAIRLGSMEGGDRVSPEERGVAPWFMEEEEEEGSEVGEELATVDDEA